MDFSALAVEIAKPEYEGLTDQQIADLLNAKQISKPRATPCWEVQKLAIESGYWASIVIAAEPGSGVPVEVRGLCISCLAWINNPRIETIDLSLSSAQGMVTGLQQAGIITEQQATTLLQLGAEQVSYSGTIGFPKLGPHHIGQARNG